MSTLLKAQEYIKSNGFEVLPNPTSLSVGFKCLRGHITYKPSKKIKNDIKCTQCKITKLDQAKQIIESNGWEFLGAYKKDNGDLYYIKYKCNNGHTLELGVGPFLLNPKCFSCPSEDMLEKQAKARSILESKNGTVLDFEGYPSYHVNWICNTCSTQNKSPLYNIVKNESGCHSCYLSNMKGVSGRPALKAEIGQRNGDLVVLQDLGKRKDHSFVLVRNEKNGVEREIPTAAFFNGKQKLRSQEELKRIYGSNILKSSTSVKGSRNPKIAKHTWADILEVCAKVKFEFLNCPENKTEKVYQCSNGGIWEFRCFCGQVFYPTINNIFQGITQSCGCIKSRAEKEIREWLASLGVLFEKSDKKQLVMDPNDLRKSLEIDIFLPEYKIGIEHNGIRVHGEKFLSQKYDTERAREHALTKHRECAKRGIRLITIFGDEWILKKDQVKAYICSILGKKDRIVGARKCAVIKYGAKQLCKDWHLQGSAKGAEYSLVYHDKVVAAAIFGKKNASRGGAVQGEYELVRFCVAPGFSVPGALSKLIKAFKQDTPDALQLISFSDNRWSVGKLYESTGFTKIHEGVQSYWYFKEHAEYPRIHRYTLRKQVLLERHGGDPNKKEWELAQEAGYDRIWDLGATKWVKAL